MPEKIVQLNEEAIKGKLKELVRESVEEMLNKLLGQKAQQLTRRHGMNAARPGRNIGADTMTGTSPPPWGTSRCTFPS